MKLRRIRGQDAQRFGSTANLNIHLHCLVLDGVYHTSEDTTVFHPVRAPSPEQLQILLHQLIKCVMKLLTRRGYLIEEQDMVYMAETDTHTRAGYLCHPSVYVLGLRVGYAAYW